MPRHLTATGRRCELYTKPAVLRYSAEYASTIVQHLRDIDTQTSVCPINAETEIKLEWDGRTVHGGYRFTRLAFLQAAQLLAPGLSKLLPNISGTVALPDSCEDLVNGRMAVRIWNDMVDLRFPICRFCRIIRNERNHTIEGMIGRNHQYLENFNFYNCVEENLRQRHPQTRMYGAQLVGRRLSLWFRNTQPMFTVAIDDEPVDFYHGYYFTNGEATGVAARGTRAVFSRYGVALGPYRGCGGRVTHKGKGFQQRLGQMLAHVASADIQEEAMQRQVESLLTTPLGFDLTMTSAQQKLHRQKLIRSVSHLGIPQRIVADAVDDCLKFGRQIGNLRRCEYSVTNRTYSSRTLLDLFVSLSHLARRVGIDRRERIEQAAYAVLTGRFTV